MLERFRGNMSRKKEKYVKNGQRRGGVSLTVISL